MGNKLIVIKAQSSIIVLIILVGVALTLGISFLSYFNTISRESTRELQRDSYIAYEMTNQMVRLIAVDNTNNNVWLLFRRLDNSNGTFYMIIESITETGDSIFLDCSSIYTYLEDKENGDGFVCYSNSVIDTNECPTTTRASNILPKNALIKPSPTSDWVNLNYYKSLRKEPLIPQAIPVCKFEYPPGKNQIVLIKIDINAYMLRLYIALPLDNSMYIIKTYEVGLK